MYLAVLDFDCNSLNFGLKNRIKLKHDCGNKKKYRIINPVKANIAEKPNLEN